jgi:hypothetical protein
VEKKSKPAGKKTGSIVGKHKRNDAYTGNIN